jgi:hypothetical protein
VNRLAVLLVLVVSAIATKANEADITGLWQGGFSLGIREAQQVEINRTKSPQQASVKFFDSAVTAPVQKDQNKIRFVIRDGEFSRTFYRFEHNCRPLDRAAE